MLDLFAVFTRGGIVLFAQRDDGHARADQHATGAPSAAPPRTGHRREQAEVSDTERNDATAAGAASAVAALPELDRLARTVLLEYRAGQSSIEFGRGAVLRWALANERELVFAALAQRYVNATYVEQVLDAAKMRFLKRYATGAARNGAVGDQHDEAHYAEFAGDVARLEKRVQQQTPVTALTRQLRETSIGAEKTEAPRADRVRDTAQRSDVGVTGGNGHNNGGEAAAARISDADADGAPRRVDVAGREQQDDERKRRNRNDSEAIRSSEQQQPEQQQQQPEQQQQQKLLLQSRQESQLTQPRSLAQRSKQHVAARDANSQSDTKLGRKKKKKEARVWSSSSHVAQSDVDALDFSSGRRADDGDAGDAGDNRAAHDSEEVRRARARFLEAKPVEQSVLDDDGADADDDKDDNNDNVKGSSIDDDATDSGRKRNGDVDRDDDSSVDNDVDAALSSSRQERRRRQGGGGGGGIFAYFATLAGNKPLTHQDLQTPLAHFRDKLVSKNVASQIAAALTESVGSSLEGKRMDAFTVRRTVRGALEHALARILTPQQGDEFITAVRVHRARQESTSPPGQRRPYVMVFCGVNGVGKSTSLAKVCYYLQRHDLKVLIAACDTFRAGAVEQLRTHAHCLGVELYDRGYGKDAASVASEAIQRAQSVGVDVVLVDTAGRMQDNVPLMRALAKLVSVNAPDRVVFVGEALVGNDAVDQVVKFNQALEEHQSGGGGGGAKRSRLIDGILLTKFDTVDDKVGAALTLVYTTSQPIVFVGIGQTYMDLRAVNAHTLVNALLK